MKKVIEYIRLVFISFEFLYTFAISVLAVLFPSVLIGLGDAIKGNSDVTKWIPVLPLAICGVVFKLAWRLTTPSSGSNRMLYDWPEYWRLACRRGYSIFLSAVLAIAAVSLWVFSKQLTALQVGYVFSVVLGVAVVDMACLAFAGFKIKEIMEE